MEYNCESLTDNSITGVMFIQNISFFIIQPQTVLKLNVLDA